MYMYLPVGRVLTKYVVCTVPVLGTYRTSTRRHHVDSAAAPNIGSGAEEGVVIGGRDPRQRTFTVGVHLNMLPSQFTRDGTHAIEKKGLYT